MVNSHCDETFLEIFLSGTILMDITMTVAGFTFPHKIRPVIFAPRGGGNDNYCNIAICLSSGGSWQVANGLAASAWSGATPSGAWTSQNAFSH